ncbi:hypothetical protein [Nisaea sediminum]|uniref:hypothetical protein n=1 Tax=Nisaea sediminum TaxID=2775867 RepID=UPI001867285C|nr:hypothetical protein [Nisaea sediminum]
MADRMTNDVVMIPRGELEMLLEVARAARRYERRSHNAGGVGTARDARKSLLEVVERCGDPAKMRAAAVLDGGSCSSVTKPQVATPDPVFNSTVHSAPAAICEAYQRRQDLGAYGRRGR